MDEAKLIQQFEAAGDASPTTTSSSACAATRCSAASSATSRRCTSRKERVAKDLSWFVTRERRGSVAAVALVRDFEAWARAKGVKFFVLGQSTGVRMDTTRALYEHLGYEMIGFNTMKRIA
jgi:GNAT superfamily N-acetyltransferase